jgi:hypothetical protein
MCVGVMKDLHDDMKFCLIWIKKARVKDKTYIWVVWVVYYESRKWDLKKRRKNEDRFDEKLKTKEEESTWLGCTGLFEELEHLKIKTRLINAKVPNVMGEYAIVSVGAMQDEKKTRSFIKTKSEQKKNYGCCYHYFMNQ